MFAHKENVEGYKGPAFYASFIELYDFTFSITGRG